MTLGPMTSLREAMMTKHELALTIIAAIHTEYEGRCIECSRIICLGTPNGLGSIQYPCLTIQALQGALND